MPFYKRYIPLAFLVCLTASPQVMAQSFETLLQSALAHHSGIQAGYQEWQARRQSADASGFLPDPMIAVDYFTTPIETRTGPQQQRLMLEQKLPWFGTRDLQKVEKQQQAQAFYWQWQAQQLELQRQLGELYGELFQWQESRRIAQQNIQLLQELEAIVRARYQVANARQPDLIRIQIELSKASDRLITLEQQQPALRSRLMLLTGNKELQQDWPQKLPGTYMVDSLEVLQQRLQAHPAVVQWQEMGNAASSAATLADKKYGPDITLRYGHIFTDDALNPAMEDSGKDPEYVGLAFNIPIWSTQYDSQRKAALSRSQSAQSQQDFTLLQLQAQLDQGLFQLRDGERRLKLYRDELIPRTEQALQAQLRAYQTADGGFLDLLDTEKQLLELQLMQAQAEQQRWNAYHLVLMASGQRYPGVEERQ